MAGMYKTDHEVLTGVSNNLINHIGEYRGTVDHMQSRTEEVASHAIVGPMGMALVNKVNEFHQAAYQFLDKVEEISHGVGTFANQAVDQEHENESLAHAVDIDFHH